MKIDAVIEVTEATFETDVLSRSSEVPVVVDFWAAWCGPCRTLGPILERLAREADGGWILAKVDVDANPGLAARFRVQGIPAVHAFRDGAEVARFVGALPEPNIRSWLKQLGPSEADVAVEQARAAEQTGDAAAAAEAYRRALQHEPSRRDAVEGLARAELALRVGTTDAVEGDGLDAAIAAADRAFAAGDVDRGAELLLEHVRTGDAEARERARQHLVGLLDTLPPDDARALAVRRALAAALF